MTEKQPRFSRRATVLLWLSAIGLVIGILIYLEQIAFLYVLATLALVALLLTVGFSDLKSVDRDKMRGFASDGE